MLGKQEKKKILQLSPESILPNPSQPRKHFSQEELEPLAESIRRNGLLQPVTVRRGERGWELVAGERRLRASKIAGLETIPCIVCSCSEEQSAIFAMIENLQRQDLDPFEEAEGIRRLISEWNVTQEEAAARLGKSQSAIANKLRLLRFTQEERNCILEGNLSERHARSLLRLEPGEKRMAAIRQVREQGLTVSQTEELTELLLEEEKEQGEPQLVLEKVRPKKKILLKDVRIFVNTILHAVDTMRKCGIPAESLQDETDTYIEYRVRIPKESAIKNAHPHVPGQMFKTGKQAGEKKEKQEQLVIWESYEKTALPETKTPATPAGGAANAEDSGNILSEEGKIHPEQKPA